MNFPYIFDLLEIVNKHNVRFSISIPNSDKEANIDVIEYYKSIKPFIMRFLDDCISHNIAPNNDCNSMPHCILDIEDKKTLIKLSEISSRYNVLNTITSAKTCAPVIDILPDLNAVRCFGLSKN